MRVLVLSDSHSYLSFMRQCARVLHPDVILHLGDYYDDGEVIRDEFPSSRFYQVPGNCDCGRTPMGTLNILRPKLDGVEVFMTHGHLHFVKQGIGNLLADARRVNARLVLYGHTHIPFCEQMEDGMWVMNPGTCGYGGKTAGIVELSEGKVIDCHIISEADLLDFS